MQHLIVIDPKDIRSYRIGCRACQASVSFRTGGERTFPASCPNCGAAWRVPWAKTVDATITHLEQLASPPDSTLIPFDLRLEIADSETDE